MAADGGIYPRGPSAQPGTHRPLQAAADSGRPAGPVPRAFRPIPPKLYRISEIVDYTGVSRQTIHNYTTMGLITESRRTHGGHRLYDESVFARLDLIAELKRQNRTMREIRSDFEKLDSAGSVEAEPRGRRRGRPGGPAGRPD